MGGIPLYKHTPVCCQTCTILLIPWSSTRENPQTSNTHRVVVHTHSKRREFLRENVCITLNLFCVPGNKTRNVVSSSKRVHCADTQNRKPTALSHFRENNLPCFDGLKDNCCKHDDCNYCDYIIISNTFQRVCWLTQSWWWKYTFPGVLEISRWVFASNFCGGRAS